MITYKLVAGSLYIQRSDGAFIPSDPGNTDWQAYLSWLALGNTPLPADPLPESTVGVMEQRLRTLEALADSDPDVAKIVTVLKAAGLF